MYFLTGQGRDYFVTELAGLSFLAVAAWFAYRTHIDSGEREGLRVALLAFILYIAATAWITAGGRLQFGLAQALSSRYLTPTLLAWACLLILTASLYGRELSQPGRLGALLLLPLLLLPVQLKAATRDDAPFHYMAAALALELSVKDNVQVSMVHPGGFGAVSGLASDAEAHHWSVFRGKPLWGLRDRIGAPQTVPGALAACRGTIDTVKPITGEQRYLRIDGWLYVPTGGRSPSTIAIVDGRSNLAGYAIVGGSRPDVAKVVDHKAGHSRFIGYVLAEADGANVVLLGQDPACRLDFPLRKTQ